MRYLQTEILVIGGGATGAGLARDLAMRGFKTALVEKGDLSHGTTGRFHGLLHSGGRYVVKDPQAAKECMRENRILRRIMPHCLEDIGGFFVVVSEGESGYAQEFVVGCQLAGIPIEEISLSQMLRAEPMLNPAIARCFQLPDASADSFRASELNAESARQHGARILTYHPVIRLLTGEDRRVVGALCHDLFHDEEVVIHADLVVNASGAWAGKITATIGVPVHISPGKGTMVAISQRVVNTVINRCKMPSDGDIIVPAHTVAIIGTTDVQVADPDSYAIEPWEVRLMLDEGEKLIPALKSLRVLRAWAGVRPLYAGGETKTSESREITRTYALLDHETRDGVPGLITITSGKWTTYRLMAEATTDLVCAKLGVSRPCRTHLEPLPGVERGKYHHLGGRLARIEQQQAWGELVCECELATRADVVHAITVGAARTLDDIRRDVRLGMGPCQGGFCAYRAAGILHQLSMGSGQWAVDSGQSVLATNAALLDFLQERWKGLVPILWGQQLRQERLDELIYLSLLNVDHLPGEEDSSQVDKEAGRQVDRETGRQVDKETSREVDKETSREVDKETSRQVDRETGRQVDKEIRKQVAHETHPFPSAPLRSLSPALDALVIGGGLAGLTAAWQLATHGQKVRLITKGWGATHWHAGCVDALGYHPPHDSQPVDSPLEALTGLIRANPHHPYALTGIENLDKALRALQSLCAASGYPLHGSLERNWLLPSAMGAVRPTCLAPETMIAGDLRQRTPMLLVGFDQLGDFYPALIADNLTAQGFAACSLTLDLPCLQARRFLYPTTLAQLFETPDFRAEVIRALRPKLNGNMRIGFPAALGMENAMQVKRELENALDCPVFEVPMPPPSIPGIRLHQLLIQAIERAGGRVFVGMEALSAQSENGRVTTVFSEAAARHKAHRAESFVLATGGILGGGITVNNDGYAQECVFGLPVSALPSPTDWLRPEFIHPAGHPIFRAGIAVDASFRPITEDGRPFRANLYAIGTGLAHADFLRERSFDGVALATGFSLARQLAEQP